MWNISSPDSRCTKKAPSATTTTGTALTSGCGDHGTAIETLSPPPPPGSACLLSPLAGAKVTCNLSQKTRARDAMAPQAQHVQYLLLSHNQHRDNQIARVAMLTDSQQYNYYQKVAL